MLISETIRDLSNQRCFGTMFPRSLLVWIETEEWFICVANFGSGRLSHLDPLDRL
jgi:hypothetical protein